jgi:polar amino acid transport system substrate-binding protein
VDNALHALTNGNLDLVVGPISITSKRIEHMRFSQPFYNSSLAIVSRKDKLGLWEKVKPLFSIRLLIAIIGFLIILLIVGTLFWFAERKESPNQFPRTPVNGIANGMWLAIVTMSTTGYGDKAPVTLWGRIIAGSWMVISIIFATSMVAGIASTLTLSSLSNSTISNIEQLSERKAATISGSPSEVFLKENNITAVGVNTLREAVNLLRFNKVDAVVYDRPQLLYYLKKNQDENLYIAKAEYYKQGYGFAFPMNTTLVYKVNRALLELAEDQNTQRIIDYYLNKDE